MRNYYFQIKNLKNVLFFGTSIIFKKFIEINDKYNLNTEIFTSKHQSKNLSKDLKYKIVNKIDKKFENYISKNYLPENTLFFSLGSRWIFKKNFIKFCKGNLVNFHAARLPQDAGGGSFSWRIMKNDRINNLLIHNVIPKIDGGQIIYYKKKLFPKSCNLPVDFKKELDIRLLEFYLDFIRMIKNKKKFYYQNQPEYLSTYYPRLDSNTDSWIDWSMSGLELERFIDAFDDPYKGCLTKINTNRETVRIKKVQLHGGETTSHKYMKGLIIRNDSEWIVVAVDDKNYLLIEEVLDLKGRNIINKLKPGDRFYTPEKNLEKQFSKRTIFNVFGRK
jgi:methionyl-tRNA formyltransferase